MNTTHLSDLWGHFRFLSNLESLKEQDIKFMEKFLSEEYQLRQHKSIQPLMRVSGIKRVKMLTTSTGR